MGLRNLFGRQKEADNTPSSEAPEPMSPLDAEQQARAREIMERDLAAQRDRLKNDS